MNATTTIADVTKGLKDFNAEMEQIIAEAQALRERMEQVGAETASLKRSVSAEKGRRTKAQRYI